MAVNNPKTGPWGSPSPNISIPGIRGSVPSGYVIGRIDPGTGQVQLIPMSALGRQLVATGSVGGGGGIQRSYLGFFLQGPLKISQKYYAAVSHREMAFPSATAADFAYAETAPLANFSFYLYSTTGPTLVATVAWTAGNHTGTITWANPLYGTSANERFYLQMPADFDPNLANIDLLFAGDLV